MEVPERDKSIRFGLEKLYEFPFQGKRVYSFCKISKWEYLVASQTGLQLFKDGNMVENFPIYLTFVQYIPELDIILGVSTGVPYLVFISNRKKKLQSPVKFRLTISLVKQAEYSHKTNTLIVNGAGIECVCLKSIYKLQQDFPTITVFSKFKINNPLIGSKIFVDNIKERIIAMTQTGFMYFDFYGKQIGNEITLNFTTIKTATAIFREKNTTINDHYKRMLITDLDGQVLFYHSSGKLLNSFIVSNRQFQFTQFVNSEFVVCCSEKTVSLLDVKTGMILYCDEFEYQPTMTLFFNGPSIGFLIDGDIHIYEIIMPWKLFQHDSSQSIFMKRFSGYDKNIPGRIVKLSKSGIVSLVSPQNGFLLSSCTSNSAQVITSVFYDRGYLFFNGTMENLSSEERLFLIQENGMVDLFYLQNNDFIYSETLKWAANKILPIKMTNRFAFAVLNKYRDLVFYDYNDFSVLTRKKIDYKKFQNAFFDSLLNLLVIVYVDIVVIYSTNEKKVIKEIHKKMTKLSAMENSKLIFSNTNKTVSIYDVSKNGLIERAVMNMSDEVTSINIEYSIIYILTRMNTIYIGNDQGEMTKIYIPFKVHCLCLLNKKFDLLVCVDRNIMQIEGSNFSNLKNDNFEYDEDDSVQNEILLTNGIIFNNLNDNMYYITEPDNSSRRSSRKFKTLQNAIEEYQRSHTILPEFEEEEEIKPKVVISLPRERQPVKNIENRDSVLKEMLQLEANVELPVDINKILKKQKTTPEEEKIVDNKPQIEVKQIENNTQNKDEEEEAKDVNKIDIPNIMKTRKKKKKIKHKKEKPEVVEEPQPKPLILGNSTSKRRQRSQSQHVIEIDRSLLSVKPKQIETPQRKYSEFHMPPKIPIKPNQKTEDEPQIVVNPPKNPTKDELFDNSTEQSLIKNSRGETVSNFTEIFDRQQESNKIHTISTQKKPESHVHTRKLAKLKPIVKTTAKTINIPSVITEKLEVAKYEQSNSSASNLSINSDIEKIDSNISWEELSNDNFTEFSSPAQDKIHPENPSIIENTSVINEVINDVIEEAPKQIAQFLSQSSESSSIVEASHQNSVDSVDENSAKEEEIKKKIEELSLKVKEPNLIRSNPRNQAQKVSSRRSEIIKKAIEDNRRLNNSVNSDYSPNQQNDKKHFERKPMISLIPQISTQRKFDLTPNKIQTNLDDKELSEIVNQCLFDEMTSSKSYNMENMQQIFSRSGRRMLITQEDCKKLLEKFRMMNINYESIKFKKIPSGMKIAPKQMIYPKSLTLPKLKNGEKLQEIVDSDLEYSDDEKLDTNDDFVSSELDGSFVKESSFDSFKSLGSQVNPPKIFDNRCFQIEEEQLNMDGTKKKRINYF
ncbi:hypothetical protein TVAG_412160 [Trichomonas vaginalis G3]|uniref:Uncharacterized protein n=1 Tax=Trichomonas vaginalis (strain ATCC PRA-98 / G3) TaxID=412133 RepID=A2F1M2_TRIV3|nr:WD40 repeat-like family [Trichomonas vaginalis G3]EAY01187.1 hypothetical protein TVAG_412160 [Trichomonas vaginalis G3]KAI5513206.1 WD40 repeat-like family [Trichomonas vaginalis G3]|eukprot:XP_001314023.1 hypothetical protein [Trichomonas vaginalis G3]